METFLSQYNITLDSISLFRVRTQSFDHVTHVKIIYRTSERAFVAKININFADNRRKVARLLKNITGDLAISPESPIVTEAIEFFKTWQGTSHC